MIFFMPYFFRKLGKISKNLSSAAVMIGILRVNTIILVTLYSFEKKYMLTLHA